MTSWNDLLRPGAATHWFVDPPPAFDPANERYDSSNAWWLGELCRLVYREEGRAEILADQGFVEHAFFDHGGTQCAVVKPMAPAKKPYTILVFRGTDEIRDWLHNVRVVPSAWPRGGNVHLGFARALEKVWSHLERRLEILPAPVFYAGHSLGGALATLAASLRPPHAVYTYGCPRVGDAAFAATLAETRVFHVVNHKDIVPTLPPSIANLRFAATGELHYISSDGERVIDPSEGEVRADRDVRKWQRERHLEGLLRPPERLEDHAPIRYVEALHRNF